jgi:replicative DNA helicase
LAGRPGMGTSELGLNIALNALTTADTESRSGSEIDKRGIAYFSFEMAKDHVARILLAIKTGIPLWRIANGKFTDSEWEAFVLALADMKESPLSLTDGIVPPEKITSEANRLGADRSLALIVVDGVHQIGIWSDDDPSGYYSALGKAMKSLAMKLGVPVLVTANIATEVRHGDIQRPKLSDLTALGSLEKFADRILFLHREAHVLLEREPDPSIEFDKHQKWIQKMERIYGRADLAIGKNKGYEGDRNVFQLEFDGRIGRFSDISNSQRIAAQTKSASTGDSHELVSNLDRGA